MKGSEQGSRVEHDVMGVHALSGFHFEHMDCGPFFQRCCGIQTVVSLIVPPSSATIEYLKEAFAGWYIFQNPIASNINSSY